MAEVVVQDLNPEVLERLRSQALLHGRSLQGEVKAILEAATTLSLREARRLSQQWRQRLAGRAFSDSAEFLREDRVR